MKPFALPLFLAISFIMTTCSGIDNDELRIGKAMGLNKADITNIKEITGSKIEELVIENPPRDIQTIKGIKAFVNFDKTNTSREILRGYFKDRDYLVFLAKQYNNAEGKKNVLGIIASEDQFDIVRIQKTEDTEKHKTTDMIVDRLKEWEKQFGFEIIGADSYWIEAVFTSKPRDMYEFTVQLTNYCPELLDDGTGKIEDIIIDMTNRNSFYLFFR